jgi:hypothetical protein
MFIIESPCVPRLQNDIREHTKVDVLSVIVFIHLFHFLGDQQNKVSLFVDSIRKYLFFVICHQLPHVFALEEKMIVFTERKEHVSDGISFVSAKFYAVEVRLAYFESVTYVLYDFSGLEV